MERKKLIAVRQASYIIAGGNKGKMEVLVDMVPSSHERFREPRMQTLRRWIWIVTLCLAAGLKNLPAESMFQWQFLESPSDVEPAVFFNFTGPSLVPSSSAVFTLFQSTVNLGPSNCSLGIFATPTSFLCEEFFGPFLIEGVVATPSDGPWHLGENTLVNSGVGNLVVPSSEIPLEVVDIRSLPIHTTPEPSTLGLVVLAFASMLVFTRRDGSMGSSTPHSVPKSNLR